MSDAPLLEIHGLCKYFPVTRGSLFRQTIGEVKAVDGVSLTIQPGETVGLVGESGCGKTTLGRCILKLERPSHGEIRFQGEDIFAQNRDSDFRYRRQVQAIFQDPFSSLNPRLRVRDLIAEPLLIHRQPTSRRERDARVLELLDLCGLPQRLADRYPHEMSGGQRQRVGIARAIALNPRFIVCDEAVSALDVSIQAQVINLLEDLRDELGLTYLFIAHDLAVVRHLCQRVAVMYLGKIVEVAPADTLFADPKHPYTRALLDAVPVPDPVLEAERPHQPLPGEIPSPLNPPSGCVFHPRCSLAVADCQHQIPTLRPMGSHHRAACTQVRPAHDAIDQPPEVVHEKTL